MGWLDCTGDKLTTVEMISLGKLNTRIATGWRWYRTMPAVGEAKAQLIAQLGHLASCGVAVGTTTFALVATPSSPFLLTSS